MILDCNWHILTVVSITLFLPQPDQYSVYLVFGSWLGLATNSNGSWLKNEFPLTDGSSKDPSPDVNKEQIHV